MLQQMPRLNFCNYLVPFISLFLFLLLFHSSITNAFMMRRPNQGLMKLCPPGGESFTAAWEITCGMRRKKRSLPFTSKMLMEDAAIPSPIETKRSVLATGKEQRAPSMTEMMLLCCRFGCSLRDLMPYCDPFGQWDS